jgi:hypothetical protein
VDNTVYAFVKLASYYETDYSKEAIAEFASGINLPDIVRLGESENGDFTLYSMPYYNPLTKESGQAWKEFQQLKRIWSGTSKSYDESGYDYNLRIIEQARQSGLDAGLIESLESINDACTNYGLDYRFEFAQRNLKVDGNNRLILLDVIFNARAD